MNVQERPYLSIGEVLGLLLEEFPDVTISKIRFLESQGLIDPERTPSGYRKFYEADVELLRVILREQRQNYLPLKVIRQRLENGEIDDPSGSLTPPRGIRNVPTGDGQATDGGDGQWTPDHDPGAPAPAPAVAADGDPSPGDDTPESEADDGQGELAETVRSADVVGELIDPVAVKDPTPVVPMAPLSRVSRHSTSATELCASAGMNTEQLAQLEEYGVLAKRARDGSYSPVEVEIAKAASGFLRRGVEARHLRGWRQAVDREAGLFEQIVLPYLRQRNPQSRRQAIELLEELAQLGGELRATLLHSALARYLEG